jgi:hypothetical protein
LVRGGQFSDFAVNALSKDRVEKLLTHSCSHVVIRFFGAEHSQYRPNILVSI